MALNFPVRKSDLAGGARLVTDATTRITDLVEAMHERIARPPGVPPPAAEGRTFGITGFVYASIRGITRAVGIGVEALVELFVPPLGSDEPSPRREAVIAALNGVLGDHLEATGNPLAKPMALRRDGVALPLEAEALAASLPEASDGVLVSIHGLCMNDLQWSRDGRERDVELADALGLTALRLDYNSGRHIHANGRDLADRLEALVDLWPRPLARIVLVGHSMGGLVARSAFRQGETAGHRWPGLVDDLVFLATPHHGAPLEKAGHWVDVVLAATPYAAPMARLGRVRSVGIGDLRHGDLLGEAPSEGAEVSPFADRRVPVPLPTSARCWAIAGALGRRDGDPTDRIVGDGLVPLASALGHHRDPARALDFARDHQRVFRGIGHLELIWSDEVFDQLRAWLTSAPPPARDSIGTTSTAELPGARGSG
ncbi:MAG: GPI inositol-deacylase [Siculibacillus sp.]|nr:GPI inositol-deacylase [Siculibacillus sp.]